LCSKSLTKQVCREKFRNSFPDTPYISFLDKLLFEFDFCNSFERFLSSLQRFHYKEKKCREEKDQKKTSREKCIFLGVGSFLVSFFSYRSQNTITTGNACSFF